MVKKSNDWQNMKIFKDSDWSSWDWFSISFPVISSWRVVRCLGLVHHRLCKVGQSFGNKNSWNLNLVSEDLITIMELWISESKLKIKTCLCQAWRSWPLPSSCFARGWGLYWPQVRDMITWQTFNGVFLHFWNLDNCFFLQGHPRCEQPDCT